MASTEPNDDEWSGPCRELTSADVGQALHTLNIYSTLPYQPALPMSPERAVECDCCRLRSNLPSRTLLPLARRGRPHFSSRSHRSLCTNCAAIKRRQQLDMLPNHPHSLADRVSQITINLSLSPDERHALRNGQYQAERTLVWRINTSDGNTVDLSYDADSLNESETTELIEDTLRKLQVILDNRAASVVDPSAEHSQFTYRTLQTTMNILSASTNQSV